MQPKSHVNNQSIKIINPSIDQSFQTHQYQCPPPPPHGVNLPHSLLYLSRQLSCLPITHLPLFVSPVHPPPLFPFSHTTTTSLPKPSHLSSSTQSGSSFRTLCPPTPPPPPPPPELPLHTQKMFRGLEMVVLPPAV